ncbi:50S ribosomal protein L30 [Gemmiger sp. An120]|nr:50S ribosomal protein L30 [Gemmiger formicilis]OUQ41070.1 50S ribosomal protein L30 [Gemmiger sp. An120]
MAETKKPAAKKPAAKKPAVKKAASLTIKLTRSLSGRSEKQIATAQSLGLKKIGDVTVQPDNAQTNGKIAKISHMVLVTKA